MGLVAVDFGSAFLRVGRASPSILHHPSIPTTILPQCLFKCHDGTRLYGTDIPASLMGCIMSQDIPVVKGLGLPDLTNPLSFRDLAGNSCSMTFPVASENNIDWPCYRQMMREAFARENIQPDGHLAFAESLMTPTATSAKLLEIMLEELEPAAVTMVAGPVAVLASYGTTTGLVLETGEVKTQVAVILEGAIANGSIKKTNLAGRWVTNRLLTLLQSSNECYFPPALSYFVGTTLKHRHAFVSPDPDVTRKMTKETFAFLRHTRVQLPDGTRLTVEDEAFRCCEGLVTLEKNDQTDGHIHAFPHLIKSSLMTLDTDARAHVLDHLVIAGGNSRVANLLNRLNRELPRVYYTPSPGQLTIDTGGLGSRKIELSSPVMPEHSIWRGTMVLGKGDKVAVTGVLLTGELTRRGAHESNRKGDAWGRLWRTRAECDEEGYARVIEGMRSTFV